MTRAQRIALARYGKRRPDPIAWLDVSTAPIVFGPVHADDYVYLAESANEAVMRHSPLTGGNLGMPCA